MGVRSFSLSGFALRRVSDEALLERAREGQELAFAELYRRFHALVYGYCLARLMDPAAAEDVAQETFLRINRSRSSEEVHSARAWVFTVARSAVIDHVRRLKRMPDSLPVDDDTELIAQGADAAEGMFRREDAKLVFLALARLRPRYRSALILREMHGLSSVEIGETMGLNPGAVDTLVCRARDAFGREYAELSDLPGDCRRAVEYMYRDRGSGIEAGERAWLAEHIAGCPRCARERRLAADPKRLAVLLPLAGLRAEGLGVFQRALETLGSAPASFEALGLTTAKVTAVAVAAAIAVAPVAGRVSERRVEKPQQMHDAQCAQGHIHSDIPESNIATHGPAAVEATVAVAGASCSPTTSVSGSSPSSQSPEVATVVVVPDVSPDVDPEDEIADESSVPSVPASAAGGEGVAPVDDVPVDAETPSGSEVPSAPGAATEASLPVTPTVEGTSAPR